MSYTRFETALLILRKIMTPTKNLKHCLAFVDLSKIHYLFSCLLVLMRLHLPMHKHELAKKEAHANWHIKNQLAKLGTIALAQ